MRTALEAAVFAFAVVAFLLLFAVLSFAVG